MNYKRNSRHPGPAHIDTQSKMSQAASFEMIPVHLTNSYEPESPTKEKRMMFAENRSLENVNKSNMKATTTETTGTTFSGTGSTTTRVGSGGEESIGDII